MVWLARSSVRAGVAAVFVAAMTVVMPGATGSVAAAGVSYQAMTPQRVLDTRFAIGTTAIAMTTPGVPIAVVLPAEVADAAGVALNLTVTEPVADGFATAYPCGVEPPLASNVNFRAGQTVPNLVIAKPSATGQVCVVTSVAAHLVVDLQGWFPAGSYEPLPAPDRVLDTRHGRCAQGRRRRRNTSRRWLRRRRRGCQRDGHRP